MNLTHTSMLRKIFQTGTQRRSSEPYRFACELIRNGRIGRLKKVTTTIGANNKEAPTKDWQPMPVPDGFDYDLWLGPAPKRPFNKNRFHYNWHWFWDTGNGDLGNQGIHQVDLARLDEIDGGPSALARLGHGGQPRDVFPRVQGDRVRRLRRRQRRPSARSLPVVSADSFSSFYPIRAISFHLFVRKR